MTDADFRHQRWIRLPVDDAETPEATEIINAASNANAGWAAYGRWVALRCILAKTPDAAILTNDTSMKALAKRLDMRPDALKKFLFQLAEVGLLDLAKLTEGVVYNASIHGGQIKYQLQCERNRSNGGRGGRPKAKR